MFIISDRTVSQNNQTASTVSQTSMFIISEETVNQNNQRQLPRYLKLLCLLFQTEQSVRIIRDSFHGISNSYVYYFRISDGTISQNNQTASMVSQTPMFIISEGTVNQNNQRQLPRYLKLLCLLFQTEQSIRTIRDIFHCISNFYVYYFRRNSQSEQSDTASTVSQTSYDPSNPNFRGLDSEIPDFVLIDTTGSSDGANSIKSKSSSTKGNFKSFFDESKRWTILLNHVLSQRNKNYDVLSQLNMMFSPN
jgi:hypothetical protein